MIVLVPALLADVIRRCDMLDRRLDEATRRTPEVRHQAEIGRMKAKQIRLQAQEKLEDATALLQDLTATGPRGADDDTKVRIVEVLTIHLDDYRRLSNQIGYHERFVLTPVEHYNSRLTRLCRALTKEIGWPLDNSLVAAYADSEDGSYWTEAHLRVIGAPTGEAACLLGLPDLCHELGHHLVQAYCEELKGPFLEVFAQHVKELETLILPKHRETLSLLVDKWQDHWVNEFASDAIAAYIAGPAFGWQHVRLCATNHRWNEFGEAVATVSETHPDDAPRLFAITLALRLTGFPREAEELEQLWSEYEQVAGLPTLRGYDEAYPDAVIKQLVESVLTACRRLKIKGFSDRGELPDSSIVALMDEAWKQFRRDASGYADWEQHRLEELWTRLEKVPIQQTDS